MTLGEAFRIRRGPARKSTAQSRAEDRVARIASAGRSDKGSRGNKVPDVYTEILSELSEQSTYDEGTSQPPRKRRRIGGGTRAQPISIASATPSGDERPSEPRPAGATQIVIDSDDSDDDEDFDWEDAGTPSQRIATADNDAGIDAITVDVSGHGTTPRKAKRKAATSADKRLFTDVHKCHVLFLLFNGHIRNMWCNNKGVESNLRTVLSAKIVGLLNPKSSLVQLRQSDLFLEGLRSATDLWKSRFKVTKPGLGRAIWAEDAEHLSRLRRKLGDDGENMSTAAFAGASKTLRGSQDTGSQLFCALLRAVGVEARLVYSLQALPITTANQKLATPVKEKPAKPRIYATFESDHDHGSSADETNSDNDIFKNPRRRLGQAGSVMPVGNYHHAPPPTAPKKRVPTLDYPVFWVEALNPAYEKWVPVDPLYTGTVGKPAKLEPPGSYDGNAMSYVIAYEDDGTAKDVTRRYTKAYNAKTRKSRVESIPDGQKWIKSALRLFRRARPTDRDQIEDGELGAKEAQEGLPNNIQDYKDHPHYALERHLKRNEIIWPKREIGKVNAGKSSGKNMESIYRRSDVHVVQSADKWYRLGREIKAKEQPMKHVPARRRRQGSVDTDEEDPELTALYAYSQTVAYIPPPVVRGKVPRNVFGNIDVYVPTMVPIGGVHVRHSLAKKAAQAVGVDFAEAVTGFQFKGRQGTAVVDGVVVAEEYGDAVRAVIQGFIEDAERHEDEAHSLECLRLWRRFILGLQIAQRIGLSDIHAADDEHMQKFREELDEAEDEQDDIADAGGFFPDSGADTVVQPTAHLFAAPPAEERKHPVLRNNTKRRRRLLDDDDEEEPKEYDPHAGVVAVPQSEQTILPQQHEISRKEHPRDNIIHAAGSQDESQAARPHSPEIDDEALPNHESDDVGGGFIVEDNTEDQEGLDVNHDEERTATSGKGNPDMDRASTNARSDDSDEATLDDGQGGGFLLDDDSAVPNTDQVMDERRDLSADEEDIVLLDAEKEAVSDHEDAASLLSHDPDDEDADPEWL